LINTKVGNERDESTDEIPKGKRDGPRISLVTVRFGMLVMESHEDLKKSVIHLLNVRFRLLSSTGDLIYQENIKAPSAPCDNSTCDNSTCDNSLEW
jgi:hypothetical protein